MKVYLDDVRKCPVGWYLARDYNEAIKLLKTGRVTEISLDHDLGAQHYDAMMLENMGEPFKYEGKTGYDVITWMEENNVWPDRIWIHTMNPAAKIRMQAALKRHEEEQC